MANQPLDNYPGLIPFAGSNDLYVQHGTISFANNATDVTLVTSLTHDIAGYATYNIAGSTWGAFAGTDGATSLSIAASSGTVTISRPNVAGCLAAGTDAKVSYMLIGRVFSTD